MKVLTIIAHLEFGGTETHVLSLARALRRHGIQIGLATYGGPLLPVMRRQGLSVHTIPKSNGAIGAALNISRIVTEYGYAAIHAHDIESFHMLPYLSKQLPDVPRVMTVHGMYYSKSELRHAATASNLILAVSPSVRERVIQACQSPNKVKWIPNGIDTHEYLPTANPTQYRRDLGLPPNTQICFYAGRFQSDKWHIARKLILASERVARKHANFMTVLVGFGGYRNQLDQLAKQVNTRLGRVAIRVLPPTTRMASYYQAATFVVGTGRVALEAMACGKPVIAAGIAGYEGIVGPKSWYLAAAHQFGDHGASKSTTIPNLSSDMDKLLLNPKLATSRGNFGRNMVLKYFSLRQSAEMTKQVYQSTLRR